MDLSKSEVNSLFASYVSSGKSELYLKYDILLIPARRNGCFLQDMDGKKYVNWHCNGGVFNLGHRNKQVIKAVTVAMQTYDIGNHHLVSKPRALCARMIAHSMPAGLNQVVYEVSGGDAVDLAIKLARGVTGRKKIISAKGGYHGHTGFALAAGDRQYKDKFKPMSPGFMQIPFNEIPALRKAVTADTAAVILETIPATIGIVVPEKKYFQAVRKACETSGALLILDEVQTGFGRTGRLWGFEHFDIVPDIVVLGKGMSDGIYPISATVYKEDFSYFFREDPFIHISTYGGSEISCFAAMEVLKISRAPSFLSSVRKMGKFFQSNVNDLSDKFPALKLKVKGLGLMMGLELKDQGTALFLLKILFDNGIYVVYSGNNPRVLQFLPPLIIDEKTASIIIKRIHKSMKADSGI
jgi:acetylornithine/succinyldiaminopimelate/putrescine aminotransferase